MKHTSLISLSACALSSAVLVPVAGGSSAAAHAVAARKPAAKNVQVLDNFYTPTKLAIKKGSQVKWNWGASDFSAHTVTLIKGPKGVAKARFSSGQRGAGAHFKLTFLKPGTYHFECMIHPEQMNMTVTVKS